MRSRVLLPVSNYSPWAEQVADVVDEVERPEDTEVVVLHVFDNADVEGGDEALDGNDDSPTATAPSATTESGIEATAERLSDAGFECDRREVVTEKDPADAILQVCANDSIDRVYMYSRNRSPAGKAIFGSTILRVLTNIPIPVTIVPMRS